MNDVWNLIRVTNEMELVCQMKSRNVQNENGK